MSEELMPCPFCGGEARLDQRTTQSLWNSSDAVFSHVACDECDISGQDFCDDPDGEEAIEWWNRRAQPAEAEGVEVVGWRIGFPNGSGYKLYEQRQDWAYEGYGSISYEVQDLMTVAQHERIVAALSARPAQRERIDPFSVAEAIRKALDRNSCPNVFLVIAYEAAIKALSQQAEPLEPAPAQDEREIIGVERYRVEPTGRGFWSFCVRAGNGERELFIGHRKTCEQVAAELATAFEDGKFVATRPAQTERQALVAWATRLYNTGYHAGHNDTVEGGYTHVYQQDMDSYHEEVALEWLTDNPQPAPPARHSQTEQQPTVKDCLTVQPMAYAVFADNGNVACFSTQREHPSIVAFEADGHSVVALAPIAQTAQGDDQ